MRSLKMQTKMALLSFGLVFSSLVIGGTALIQSFSASLEREMSSRALAIARSVAQVDEIQRQVGRPGGERVIQPIAERIRLATNVEYVVVFDMQKRRYSHPWQELIGQEFSGGDEGPSLADHEYTSRARGVLGPSVRAFVPIKVDEGTRQVGVVVVGILTPTWYKLLYATRLRLYFSLAAGLAVGLLGSLFLARNIKRTMFNLEPVEIARLLEERSAVFQSISEGIVAIDREGRVTVANEEARRILGLPREVVGREITELIPDSPLMEVLRTGEARLNQERFINNTVIISNRVPIKVKGQVVGAVSSFKEKTEVQRLAEELTGVKNFIEALRGQNHEHMNKLHTIAGLIQLKRYDQALDFIFQETEEQQELTQFLARNIRDYSVAGLLLGKYSRAKEMKVEMTIDPASRLTTLPRGLDSSSLVVVLGNLLENALEAVSEREPGRRRVKCRLRESAAGLHILVEDSGVGVDPRDLPHVFRPGFTTKRGDNNGYGLALVQRYVDLGRGSIDFRSFPGEGTRVELFFPAHKG